MKRSGAYFFLIFLVIAIPLSFYSLVEEPSVRMNYLLTYLIAVLSMSIFLLLFTKQQAQRTKHQHSFKIWRRTFLIFCAILMTGIGIWLVIENARLNKEIDTVLERIETQKLEAQRILRQQNLQAMMGNLLNKVDRELEQSKDKKLTASTIERIADYTKALDPAQLHQLDSLPEGMLSFERGQLLMALSKIQMDSTSFAFIRKQSDFSGADLRNMDLKGVDLSGITLAKANLMDADLRGSNFQNANLAKANFRRANLSNAILAKANLKRAQMDWTKLNEANLEEAALNGVNLNAAQLRKAKLDHSSMTFAKVENAFLEYASLKEVDLTGTKMNTSVLREADLTGAILNWLELKYANLDGVKLAKAYVNVEEWLSELNNQEVLPPMNYEKHYMLEPDSMAHNQFVKFRIERIAESN